MRLVAEARREDPELSLNAAVVRIGQRTGVNADTLRGWAKQAAIEAGHNRATAAAARVLRDRDDVALIGFDDFELADLLDISAVAYDTMELGRALLRGSRWHDSTIRPALRSRSSFRHNWSNVTLAQSVPRLRSRRTACPRPTRVAAGPRGQTVGSDRSATRRPPAKVTPTSR